MSTFKKALDTIGQQGEGDMTLFQGGRIAGKEILPKMTKGGMKVSQGMSKGWLSNITEKLGLNKGSAYALSKDVIKEYGEKVTLGQFKEVAKRHGITERMISKMFTGATLKNMGKLLGAAGFVLGEVTDAKAAGVEDEEEMKGLQWKQKEAAKKIKKGTNEY